MEKKERIFLLDGHSLTHRAFYALPPLTNDRGEYTNAAFGFMRMFFSMLDEEKPDRIIVTFDKKAPTFRHEEYDEYKANRKKMPDELAPQFPMIQETLNILNIPVIAKEGYEADDVLGTLARKAEEAGFEVVIVSGDRDTLQLVTENIKVMYTRKGISDIVLYDPEKVKEKYELSPEQIIDMKGLMGDSSDNIPGVPGIGEKTSTKLLKEFATLENVLANIENISGKKRKENLKKYADQARMSYKLAKILTDVPLEIDFGDCIFEGYDVEEVVKQFKMLGFNSMLDRFQDKIEIEMEEIEIIEINQQQQLQPALEKLLAFDQISLFLKLAEPDKPLQSEFEFLLVGGEEKLYKFSFSEIDPALLKDLLESDNEKLIIDAKRIYTAFLCHDIRINKLTFAPLLASYLLHPSDQLPELEDIYARELNIDFADLSAEEKSIVYIEKLPKLKKIMNNKLKDVEVDKLFTEIELPLIPVLAQMEYNGVKIDKEWLNSLSEKLGSRLDKITDQVYEIAGEEFNLNSPKQLGEILFDKLGLPVIKKTKTGYSTSISVLEELEEEHQIIPLIMDYRTLAKLKSTYVDTLPPLINEKTGRIHTSFNQMVTATGRLSSTDPNLQNIPIRTEEGREIRKAFVPRKENMVLLAIDYSQIELRVFAHLSGDQDLSEAFNCGRDIHTETASEIFEVDSTEVTSDMRRHAKVINFGIAYGMSAYGLSQDLGISRNEAQNYIDKYFAEFSGVKKHMDQTIEFCKENGYVTTLFNRRRYIPEINSKNFHRRSFAERTAINTPVQGTAADIMKKAMIDVYQALKETDLEINILLQVHDELVFEVAKKDLIAAACLLKDKMEKAVQLDVPVTVDLQQGDNWRDKSDLEVDCNA